MVEFTPPSPEVLGRFLLLQSGIYGTPDDRRLAEFLTAGLARLPGVRAVACCQRGEILACSPAGVASTADDCRANWAQPGVSDGCRAPCSKTRAGWERIPLRGPQMAFGGLLFQVADAALFESCRPYLENTVNLAAVVMENRAQNSNLSRLNQNLEAEVEQRTAELRRELAQRVQVEADLRKSELLYQDLVETSQDLIWQCDADHRFIYLNAAWEKVFGHPRNAMLGQTLADFQTPETLAGAPSFFAQLKNGGTLKNGATLRGHETVARDCDGRELHLVFNAVTARDEEGVFLGSRGTAYNVTLRRQAEAERARLERQILQAQKLESLGVLAGGIAHDFNNLLTAIMGNLSLALLDLSPASPSRLELQEAEIATRRAADLARQMLTYSGKGRFLVERLDLQEVVDEMVHMLQVSISKKAVLRFNFAANLPAIEADATQLRQVIMNLVINASEAIGERSGVIAISTGAMDCDRKYLADTWLQDEIKEGLYVYLEVADTGCGISADQISKIFDPFFSTKFTGRGLGLAAVLGIIRGHKGAIKVYSELGKGTTFKVLFPASDQPASRSLPGQVLNNPWRGQGTVLLVDDEESVRAIGKKALERLGFQVITATDGRHAVELFRAFSPQITCVLMDLTMPHMDGEEAFREIRRIQPDASVILASGYSEQDVVSRFVGKGLAGFIQKPFQIAILQDSLQKHFESHPVAQTKHQGT